MKGPESYNCGEEVYSLIAGLVTLQGRPQILLRVNLDFINFPRSGVSIPSTSSCTDESVSEDVKGWIDENRLCGLFFEKLITHRSNETSLSSEPDGTLIGL